MARKKRRDFPVSRAWPYAWPIPATGKVSASRKLRILPQMGAALITWVRGGGAVPYGEGGGCEALDELLRKVDSRQALLGAANNLLWVVDGYVGLRLDMAAPEDLPKDWTRGSSPVDSFLWQLQSAELFEIPNAPLIYGAVDGVHVYIGLAERAGVVALTNAESLAVLASQGTICRRGELICARNAAGEIVAFCNIVERNRDEGKDAAGALWAPDGVDTRPEPAPAEPPRPTYAAKPAPVATLAKALKAVSWQRSIAAYAALVQELRALCDAAPAAEKGTCFSLSGPIPSGCAYFKNLGEVFTWPDGLGCKYIGMSGGLLAGQTSTPEHAQFLANGIAQFENMKQVALFTLPEDLEMDRAADGTPQLWLGNGPDGRTPVPAVDFLGALHALAGEMPKVATVELRCDMRTNKDGYMAWVERNHFVRVSGVLDNGTPWMVMMPELRGAGDTLPRWRLGERPLTSAEKKAMRW